MLGADRVGLIDGGLEQGVQPVPGECTWCGCEACIDEPGLVLGELSGGGGDVAGLAARRLPGDGGRPNLREPVSQV